MLTKVSRSLIEDNSITPEKLALNSTGAGNVLVVNDSGQLELNEGIDLSSYALISYVDEQITNAVTNGTIDLSDYALRTELFSGSYDDLTNSPVLFDGDYNSLTNLPILVVSYDDLTNLPTLFDGDYNSLTNIPTIPSNVSELDNDSLYVQNTELQSVAFSGLYDDLLLKPTLFSGSYDDLTDKPALFTGSYTDLTNKPTLFDGQYSSLVGHPTKVSTFTNDAGYITLADTFTGNYADLTNKPVIPSDLSDLTDTTNLYATETFVNTQIANLVDTAPATLDTLNELASALGDDPNFATTISNQIGTKVDQTTFDSHAHSYNDLTDTPTIPTVPTNISAFTNDSDYVQTNELETVAFSGLYNDLLLKPTLFSGSYNDLTDKPALFTGSYTDLTNTPSLFDGQYSSLVGSPTKVSTFTNDAGYITASDIPNNHMENDSSQTISGSIYPSVDNLHNLGNTTHQWNTIYGHTVEATYADLAERYEADAPYDEGTVLVFGGEAEVTACRMDTDVRVAGIVSVNPGLKLNSTAGNSETHPYIALKGRVPCKVIGPVKKGDLLVTSDTPGYARSCGGADMGHAVLGKALETNLTGGEKLIEVFVV